MDDAFARWPDGYQESVPGLLVEDVKRHRLGKEELQAKCKKKQERLKSKHEKKVALALATEVKKKKGGKKGKKKKGANKEITPANPWNSKWPAQHTKSKGEKIEMKFAPEIGKTWGRWSK